MIKLNDLKNIYKDRKKYIETLTNFEQLNKYIYYSSIFLNRLELILYSDDLSLQQKLDNIVLSYSDFKVNNLEQNFNNGVSVDNKFETKEVL